MSDITLNFGGAGVFNHYGGTEVNPLNSGFGQPAVVRPPNVPDPYYTIPSGYAPQGAPDTVIQPPTPHAIGRTLDVRVVEQIRIASGDAQATSLKLPSFVDSLGAGENWANVQAAYTDDDINATVTLGADETSSFLSLGGFDANIPTTATILGIEVEVTRKVLQGSVVSDSLSSMTCQFVEPTPDYNTDTYWSSSDATYDSGTTSWEFAAPAFVTEFTMSVVGSWLDGSIAPAGTYIEITFTTDTAMYLTVAGFGGFLVAGSEAPIGTTTVAYYTGFLGLTEAETELVYGIPEDSTVSIDNIAFTDVDNGHDLLTEGG